MKEEVDLMIKRGQEISSPKEGIILQSIHQPLQEIRNALLGRALDETPEHTFQRVILNATPNLVKALSKAWEKFKQVARSSPDRVNTLEKPTMLGYSWVGREIVFPEEEGVIIGVMNPKDWQRHGKLGMKSTELTIRTPNEVITAYFWPREKCPSKIRQEGQVPLKTEKDELTDSNFSRPLKTTFEIEIKKSLPKKILLEAESAVKAYAPAFGELDERKRTSMQMVYAIEWEVGDQPRNLRVIHGPFTINKSETSTPRVV